MFPSGQLTKEDARLLLNLALELRLLVRVQLHTMSPQEFGLVEFTYVDRESGAVESVAA